MIVRKKEPQSIRYYDKTTIIIIITTTTKAGAL
jgi:hypothetical protein